jgi:hypothetical protein
MACAASQDDVRAVDVSDANDWSEVRVWYAPIGIWGTTHWPVDGFIYNRTSRGKSALAGRSILARGESAVPAGTTPRLTLLSAPAKPAAASRNRIDASFLDGLSSDKPSNLREPRVAPIWPHTSNRPARKRPRRAGKAAPYCRTTRLAGSSPAT